MESTVEFVEQDADVIAVVQHPSELVQDSEDLLDMEQDHVTFVVVQLLVAVDQEDASETAVDHAVEEDLDQEDALLEDLDVVDHAADLQVSASDHVVVAVVDQPDA